MLTVSKEAEDLANALMAHGAVPIGEPEDVLHIALTVVNDIEYLVRWNFKHIANAVMRLKIEKVCIAAGHNPNTICSPEELFEAQP